MDWRVKWTKPIKRRPRNLYSNSNRNGIRLYKQYKLYGKCVNQYHSRRKRNTTDVWPNQWLHQRDTKYRIDLCMDRRFEWTKSIECRPRNIYGNSNRNGVGLYIKHGLYD